MNPATAIPALTIMTLMPSNGGTTGGEQFRRAELAATARPREKAFFRHRAWLRQSRDVVMGTGGR
jgi:hypothetical protein